MAVTSLLATGTAPTSDRQVWASPVALRANWKNPITVRTGFETRIEQALTLSEQRRILRGTPRRSLSCTLTGTGRVETLAARQLLTRYTMAGFLMPLYSDQMELQATAAASATVLSVDPTYRRVFVGNRVIVLHTEHGVVTDFEVHVVDAVTAGTSITLASPGLAAEAPRGSLVIPLFESRIIDSFSNGFVLTDDKADFQNFTAQEQVGPTQIDGIVAIGTNPSGFDTFESSTAGTLPVFAGPMDYSNIKYAVNRIGSISTVGIGDLPVFYGERGVQQINALIQCLSREEAWDTIRFFESRGGRAYPFWLRSPWEDYRVTGSNGNNLLVEDTGDLLDWNYRPYLVMELSDGSFDYREIESVSQNGSNHEIAFVGGAALGSIVDARQLLLVRMYRDEIAERWVNTEVCQMTLETIELLQEKAVTMTETLAASNGDSIVTSPDGDLLGLGIGVTDDATSAISPDIAMGECEGSGLPDPCDCESETDCGFCSGCTFSTIRLVLSGLSLCGDCTEHQDVPNDEYSFTLSSDINIAHDLTQTSGCVWEKTITNGLLTEKWSDDACAGSPDVSNTADIDMTLTRTNSTTYRLTIECATLVSSPTTSQYVLFVGEITVSEDDCSEFSTMTNDISESDCGTLFDDGTTIANVAAFGGSITGAVCPS